MTEIAPAPESELNKEGGKAEYARLNEDWKKVQAQIRELLRTQGKTEAEIQQDQWKVESLLDQADQIQARQSQIYEGGVNG